MESVNLSDSYCQISCYSLLMAGLREQWRRSAKRTIQARALDLFEERGFDAVTIEAVAAAAGVSPSSVYRYFGTKEGLVVFDEFEDMTPDEVRAVFLTGDPIDRLVSSVHRYEAPQASARTDPDIPDAWRRIPFFFTVPSVHAALLSAMDRASKRIAPVLAESLELTPAHARIVSHALCYGYIAALELWFEEGRTKPIADYVEDGMRPLRAIWKDAGKR